MTQEELQDYLDDLWKRFGERSVIPRQDPGVGFEGPDSQMLRDLHAEQNRSEMAHSFGDLDWQLPASIIKFKGPREGDGGGADYFFDTESNRVYQRTGYW